jgi:hypothetical protein
MKMTEKPTLELTHEFVQEQGDFLDSDLTHKTYQVRCECGEEIKCYSVDVTVREAKLSSQCETCKTVTHIEIPFKEE